MKLCINSAVDGSGIPESLRNRDHRNTQVALRKQSQMPQGPDQTGVGEGQAAEH